MQIARLKGGGAHVAMAELRSPGVAKGSCSTNHGRDSCKEPGLSHSSILGCVRRARCVQDLHTTFGEQNDELGDE